MQNIDISKLSLREKQDLLSLLEKKEQIASYNYVDTLFTDKGDFSRERYAPYMEFFKAGKTHTHRLIMAANQIGKSLMSCYELYLHCSGKYPEWWEGKRLTKPRNWWVVGENNALLRQSIISTLLGPVNAYGTGIIRHCDLDFESLTDTKKVATGVQSLRIKHVSGQFCQIDFKSYDSGRTAFQAFKGNILFDEECGIDIYNECLTRTITLGDDAMTIMNFTPMKGETELVTSFMEGHAYETGSISPSKHLTHLTWDDAPHLSERAKEELIKSYPPYMRDARTKGLPMMGVGLVYPIDEAQVFIRPLPFSIPSTWKRGFAMDFGFIDPTVVLWFAIDPDTGVVYVYHEHYLAEAQYGTHAQVILAQNRQIGYSIPGVCDPSGGGRSTADGRQTRKLYLDDFGIRMDNAINAIEPGIAKVFQYMCDGKLKIYDTCVNTKKEFRGYSRSKNGFKGADHCLAPGTLIATDRGQVPIEYVTTNDKVLTRQGFKKVIHSGISGHNHMIYNVETLSGKVVPGTLTHKIWINDNWISIDTLHKYLTQSNEQDLLCQTIKNTEILSGGESQTQTHTTNQQEVTNCLEKLYCTGSYIKTILEKFQKDTKSIILTTIKPITNLKTLLVSQVSNIVQYMNLKLVMQENNSGHSILMTSNTLQRNGTEAMREKSGTVNIVKMLTQNENQENISVNIVEKLTYQHNFVNSNLGNIDTVQETAEVILAERLGSIMNNGNVYIVEKNSPSANIQKLNVVADRVVSVTESHVEPLVYDLTVEDAHEFYANDVLVHNSMDCLKYTIMSGITVAKSKSEAITTTPWNNYIDNHHYIDTSNSDSWQLM